MNQFQNNNWSTYEQPAPQGRAISSKPEVNHITSGVVVPLLQALVTGFVCGMAALAITAWFALPWLAIGGTTAAVIMAGAWLSYRSRWQWVLERLLGADLNQDGYIGQPMPLPPYLPEPERVEVRLLQDGQHQEFIDLPASPDQLRALASGMQSGRQFATTAWVPTTFTRPEFEALRAEMIRRGLATWKHPGSPNQGVELTAAGRAVLRKFATPTPSEDDQA